MGGAKQRSEPSSSCSTTGWPSTPRARSMVSDTFEKISISILVKGSRSMIGNAPFPLVLGRQSIALCCERQGMHQMKKRDRAHGTGTLKHGSKQKRTYLADSTLKACQQRPYWLQPTVLYDNCLIIPIPNLLRDIGASRVSAASSPLVRLTLE